MLDQKKLQSAIHHHLIRGLIEDGFTPDMDKLQKLVAAEQTSIVEALKGLEQSHSLVCHPGTSKPWVVSPFTLSPTATWVQAGKRGWWAPCMWCALGIAALVQDDVVIHCRIAGKAEDIDLHVHGGNVRENDIIVHFPVPARNAWDNVHYYCATVLPFRKEADVDEWSHRHAIPKGAVVPIAQVAELGRAWYGNYADSEWQKWSIDEAREIFARVGLEGPFWALPTSEGGKPF